MADVSSGKSGDQRVHVLKLSAESANVRSLARGWAAGEVGLDDYRTVRALTIEGMLSGEISTDFASDVSATDAAAGEEDDDHDVTAVGDQTITEMDNTDPNPEPTRAPSKGGTTSLASPRNALIAGVVLLLLGLILLFTLG